MTTLIKSITNVILIAFIFTFTVMAANAERMPGITVSSGINADGGSNSAIFTIETRSINDQLSNIFDIADTFNVVASFKTDPQYVGKNAPIFMVAKYADLWFMKNTQGQWLEWDLNIHNLLPAESSRTLSSEEVVSVQEGLTGLSGQFAIYLGYGTSTGDIQFNSEAGQFQVIDKLPGAIQIPKNEIDKTNSYNHRVWIQTKALQDVMQANHDMISLASNGLTEAISDYPMSHAEMDQFYATRDQVLPSLALVLLYGLDISQLENSLSGGSAIVRARTREPRFLGVGLAVAGAALTIKSLYDYGFESYEKQFNIAEEIINKVVPGSKEHQLINEELGLDVNTPANETLRSFKQESFFSKNRLSKAIIQANTLEGDGKANIKRRTEIANTATAGGSVAVKTTVGLATTATGGQGLDKIAQIAGVSAPVAGLIDLGVSAIGVQPLDIIANKVTITAQSKETQSVSIPQSPMSLETAKNKMQSIALGDLTKIANLQELIDAFHSILNATAKKLPGATENIDGSIDVKIPESVHIENRDVLNSGDSLTVPDNQGTNLTITAENKVPESIQDIDLTALADIVLQAEDIVQQEALMQNLSAEVISEDNSSITYRVTAEVTGIKGPTEITIEVENAITSGATKELSSDGSVSWDVTVLEADATVTVTASSLDDTGNTWRYISSLSLSGAVQVSTISIYSFHAPYPSLPLNTFLAGDTLEIQGEHFPSVQDSFSYILLNGQECEITSWSHDSIRFLPPANLTGGAVELKVVIEGLIVYTEQLQLGILSYLKTFPRASISGNIIVDYLNAAGVPVFEPSHMWMDLDLLGYAQTVTWSVNWSGNRATLDVNEEEYSGSVILTFAEDGFSILSAELSLDRSTTNIYKSFHLVLNLNGEIPKYNYDYDSPRYYVSTLAPLTENIDGWLFYSPELKSDIYGLLESSGLRNSLSIVFSKDGPL